MKGVTKEIAMRCRQVEQRLLELEDPSQVPGVVGAHLEACASCRRRQLELAQAMTWVRELPLEDPSENFTWRLRLRLAQETLAAPAVTPATAPDRQRFRAALQFLATSAAAAAVVVTVGLGAQRFLRSTPPAGNPTVAAETPVRVEARPSLPALAPVRASWFRVHPTSYGAPLGPRLQAVAAPSIVGQAAPPESVRIYR